jgi:hypothetical protein
MQNDARALYYFALYYCGGNPEEKVRKQSEKQSDNLKDASEA